MTLAGDPPDRMTPARARVLEILKEKPSGWTKSALAEAAGVSTGVVDGLIGHGMLATVDLPRKPRPALDPEMPGPTFTQAQGEAVTELRASARDGYSVTLIDGVTGSGKTEVYFEAVAEVLRKGRQALVLLPEIALTSQFLERFEARFGGRPAEWHSELSPRMRVRTWRDVAFGEARVVVGARSALFLPYRDLGLIVVDEEHDSAFKQDDRVPYSARDMAVVRGHISGFPVILSSATPSVESRVNAEAGRYRRVVLEERASGAEMPHLVAIDMRNEGPERGRWLAPKLVSAMAEALADKAQSLLFLNRRGYAPLTLCRPLRAPLPVLQLLRLAGRAPLSRPARLPPLRPSRTPARGLSFLRHGRFAGGLRPRRGADRGGSGRTISRRAPPGALLRQLFHARAHAPRAETCGRRGRRHRHRHPARRQGPQLSADAPGRCRGCGPGPRQRPIPGLRKRRSSCSPRWTGRAGRIGGGGLGFLQTYAPENPVLQALLSGDHDRFYREEIAARRAAGLPPFGRLAALVVSAPERSEAEGYARALVRAVPFSPDFSRDRQVDVLGPADAPLALVRGRYRQRILVRAPRGFDLQAWLRAWLAAAPQPRGQIRVQVDVDPQSFM